MKSGTVKKSKAQVVTEEECHGKGNRIFIALIPSPILYLRFSVLIVAAGVCN